MNEKKVRTSELFDCEVPYLKHLFEENEYPWQMLSKIGALAEKLVSEGIEGFERIADGVIVGRDAVICKNVTLEPPAVIGRGCVLRPGAFVRGNVITGEKCVIGNSTELKNCILLDHVQVPHYNYVGGLRPRKRRSSRSGCDMLQSQSGQVGCGGQRRQGI